MPDVTGMDVHDELARTVPDQAEHLVFMTGGAFPLEKLFDPRQLCALVNERIPQEASP